MKIAELQLENRLLLQRIEALEEALSDAIDTSTYLRQRLQIRDRQTDELQIALMESRSSHDEWLKAANNKQRELEDRLALYEDVNLDTVNTLCNKIIHVCAALRSNQPNCIICCNNPSDTTTDCGHTFCSACIRHCDTCPICRTVLSHVGR